MNRKEDSSLIEKSIHTLNSLRRGELSAIETYDKAIAKFEHHPARATLTELRNQHEASAEEIRHQIAELEGTPTQDSGAWGSFTKVVQSTANFLGQDSALQALEQGELYGKKDYESALKDEDLLAECKELIRTDLFPRILRNMELLESLEERVV